MEHWVYHPFQKPQIVNEQEFNAYLENGWFKTYSEIPGYVPNENGENMNESDEYYAQFEDEEAPVEKKQKRGRPPRTKQHEPNPKLHVEESQGLEA